MPRTNVPLLKAKILGGFTGVLATMSRETWVSGLRWYDDARTVIDVLARRFQIPRATVANVVATLSPRVLWPRCLVIAYWLFEKGGGAKPPGTLSAVWQRAVRVYEDDAPPTGPKVEAFARALMGDDTAVVIDSWMLRAAGLPVDFKVTPTRLAAFQEVLQALSREHALPITTLQALIWEGAREGSS